MTKQFDVIIIGGGATGAGVARDCSLRGIRALLLERGDIATGATGRNHGLLHSGARYAVTDRESAEECIKENMILRRIASHCVEQTDGLFLSLPEDGLEFQAKFVEACRAAGIRADVIDPKEALRLEPSANPAMVGAVRVPDGAVDPFRLTAANVIDAKAHGAEVLTYHEVLDFLREQNRITGVKVLDRKTGQTAEYRAQVVVNAGGIWGHDIARKAGVTVNMLPAKGSLLIFGHRVNNIVLNRCRKPADADILVPGDTISLIGHHVEQGALRRGGRHVRDGRRGRPAAARGNETGPVAGTYAHPARLRRRASAGSVGRRSERPQREPRHRGARPRHARRVGGLRDHHGRQADDLPSDGGVDDRLDLQKVESYGQVYHRRGEVARLARAGGGGQSSSDLGAGGAARLVDPPSRRHGRQGGCGRCRRRSLVCECEEVSVGEVEYALNELDVNNLVDLRRRTRVGMGTCQGELCACRAAGLMAEAGKYCVRRAKEDLTAFLNERWKGMAPVAWGDTLRESEFTMWLYDGVCGLTSANNTK